AFLTLDLNLLPVFHLFYKAHGLTLGIRLFYVYAHLSSQTSYYLAYQSSRLYYSYTSALVGYLRISHYDSRITFQLSVRVNYAHHVDYVSLLYQIPLLRIMDVIDPYGSYPQ